MGLCYINYLKCNILKVIFNLHVYLYFLLVVIKMLNYHYINIIHIIKFYKIWLFKNKKMVFYILYIKLEKILIKKYIIAIGDIDDCILGSINTFNHNCELCFY